MIDYYIYGYFKDINPNAPSIKKVTGRRFDHCGLWWYYRKAIDDRGKVFYEVTMPCNGFRIGGFDRLKDAKEFITSNFEAIVVKCETKDMIRAERRFQELVAEAKENEGKS